MHRLFVNGQGELRLLWTIMVLILGTMAFSVLVNAILISTASTVITSQGLDREQAVEQARTLATGFVSQATVVILTQLFMIFLVYLLITRAEKARFRWALLGLSGQDSVIGGLKIGTALAVVLSGLTVGIGLLVGTLRFGDTGLTFFSVPQIFVSLFLATLLCVVVGFGEEIAFRGYFQQRFTRRYGVVVGVVMTSILFALAHPWGNVTNPLVYLATATLVGVLFGVLFAGAGTLWPCIALHTLWNYLQIALDVRI